MGLKRDNFVCIDCQDPEKDYWAVDRCKNCYHKHWKVQREKKWNKTVDLLQKEINRLQEENEQLYQENQRLKGR